MVQPAICLRWCRYLEECRDARPDTGRRQSTGPRPASGRAAPRLRQHPRPRARDRRAGHHRGSDGLPGAPPIARRRCARPEHERQESVRLRRGLHDALELNHAAEHAPLAMLDDALGALTRPAAVGRRRRGRHAGRGRRRGRPGPHRAGGARGSRERALVAAEDLRVRRVRVGLLRPVEEPLPALLRVRLRQQAQDPRLPRTASRRRASRRPAYVRPSESDPSLQARRVGMDVAEVTRRCDTRSAGYPAGE